MENRPKVFPTADQIAAANQTGVQIAKEQEETIMNNQVSSGEIEAATEMARRTAEQLRLREESLKSSNQDVAQEVLNPRVEVQQHTMKSPMENLKPQINTNRDIEIAVYEADKMLFDETVKVTHKLSWFKMRVRSDLNGAILKDAAGT